MATIKIEPGKLGIVIRTDARNLRKILQRGAKRGAERGRTHLVRESPVDRGMLKNAWEITSGADIWAAESATEGIFTELVNTSPYAGVVERGMRPGFKMSLEGLEALAGWVRRKILHSRGTARIRGGAIGPLTPWQNKRGTQVNDEYAASMAIARRIARKFETVGRDGKFFVRDSLGKLTVFALEEILREVNKYFGAGGGTRGNV